MTNQSLIYFPSKDYNIERCKMDTMINQIVSKCGCLPAITPEMESYELPANISGKQKSAREKLQIESPSDSVKTRRQSCGLAS